MLWIYFVGTYFFIFNVSSGFSLWTITKKAIWGEICDIRELPLDVKGLENDVKHNIFGQPFVEEALIPLLKKHLGIGMPENFTPKKALVLSFHGSSGLGKTGISTMIATYLFQKGTRSKFFKFFSLANSHELSKDAIKEIVISTVQECDRALFVFDEIEKMPNGIIGIIKPFLDFHHHVGNVDFRKSIFIFNSNIGMGQINDLAFSLWTQGLKRNEFDLSEFEKLLQKPSYNEEGGLKGTSIVKNFLVDLYLPFLPLEKEHVKKCVLRSAESMGIHLDEKMLNKILSSLHFVPAKEELYSSSGCKNIDSLILRFGKLRDEL